MVRVPRQVESKITQWVRFQHSEELADEQVRLGYQGKETSRCDSDLGRAKKEPLSESWPVARQQRQLCASLRFAAVARHA